MLVKTCLLVTDDLDDHQAFSEAVSEISPGIVVLNVLDSEKALELLTEKKCMPDYIFLDISMPGIRINTFLKAIRKDNGFRGMPTVVYGEPSLFDKIDNQEKLVFFGKDYEYSELKEFLSEFLKPFPS